MGFARSFLKAIIAIGLATVLIHCGGGSDGGRDPIDNVDPGISVDPDISLDQLAINTFLASGINLTTTPRSMDMGETALKKSLTKKFSITNSTSQNLNLTLKIISPTGAFRLVESAGVLAFKTISLPQGQSVELPLQFDAAVLGIHTGYVEITAGEMPEHYIHFPFRANAGGSSDVRVVSSSFLCNDTTAPRLNAIDFGRLASGRIGTQSFKICNVSTKPLKVSGITISKNLTGSLSKSSGSNPYEPFTWKVLEMLDTRYFDYYNLPQEGSFTEPERIPYDAPIDSPFTAYQYKLIIPEGASQPLNGFTLEPGKFVRIEVTYSPNLSLSPPEGKLYRPIPLSGNLGIATSQGTYNVDLLGTSGGLEPSLKVLPLLNGENIACDAAGGLDLNSIHASLRFPFASVFTDWIPELSQNMTLRLCNVGSKPLNVWTDPLNTGYFTFLKTDPEQKFPLKIAPGAFTDLTLKYAPTPEGYVSDIMDLGQLVLKHNGGNGPRNRVTLIGEQKKDSVLSILQDTFILKKQYGPKKARNLCAFSVSAPTDKKFTIRNLSFKYALKSHVTLSNFNKPVQQGDPQPIPVVTAISNGPDFTTAPQGSTDFTVTFTLPAGTPVGTRIEGLLKIENDFDGAPTESGTALDYNVPIKAVASESATCTGAGEAPDDFATILVDRITMNLLGLPEPARNPPAFKFHLPIKLDKKNNRARISGLKYDPTKDASPLEQIRSYAHQISNVTGGCYALSTNPYRLEFEEGSYDGPYKECSHTPTGKPQQNWKALGAAACMKNNGTQEYEQTNPDGTKQKLNVFYHEFVKFKNGACSPWFEGKYSTFHLKPGESVDDVFVRMKKEVGINGSEDAYATVTKPYQFDSYIYFHEPYRKPGCDHGVGLVTDANEIKNCWVAFANDNDVEDGMTRYNGMVEECSYFQFDIAEGCGPEDVGDARCAGVDFNKPETWIGYGEYESDTEDDTKYHLTLRNVKITAFTLVHSLNSFFGHTGKLLYSPLYVTLTTKAIGKTYPGTVNKDWDSLIAEETKKDFEKSDIERLPDDKDAINYWINPKGVNGDFTVGDDDDRECDTKAGMDFNCRGNYEVFGGKILHGGEPINLEGKNRLLLAGLGAFRGEGQMAPTFARAKPSGQGQPLFFTFHGCIHENDTDPDTGLPKKLDPTVGCYPDRIDDTVWNGKRIVEEYAARGLITQKDANPTTEEETKKSKAYINYRILYEDRDRMTDYFKYPAHFKFDADNSKIDKKCGYGM